MQITKSHASIVIGSLESIKAPSCISHSSLKFNFFYLHLQEDNLLIWDMIFLLIMTHAQSPLFLIIIKLSNIIMLPMKNSAFSCNQFFLKVSVIIVLIQQLIFPLSAFLCILTIITKLKS